MVRFFCFKTLILAMAEMRWQQGVLEIDQAIVKNQAKYEEVLDQVTMTVMEEGAGFKTILKEDAEVQQM